MDKALPGIHDITHLELWVDDAYSVANLYQDIFEFVAIAEAGPDTGLAGHHSIVLAQGQATLVVTSSIDGSGPVGEFVRRHGDGVRDVAFAVPNAQAAFEYAVAHGAEPAATPSIAGFGRPWTAVRTFGDVVHSFVDRPGLAAHYRATPASGLPREIGVHAIDHLAMCLPTGALDATVEFYVEALGFERGQTEHVETELSGMNAKVVCSGKVKFPLHEPLQDNPTGPIAEFVELNGGAGVYHAGLLTNDLCRTMRALRPRIKTLDVPGTYYDQLTPRIGVIEESLADLRELQILVDRDPKGLLLQSFTRSVHPRQTFFIEVIQRKGAVHGFGSANVRALFDAIEADRRALAERERYVSSPRPDVSSRQSHG